MLGNLNRPATKTLIEPGEICRLTCKYATVQEAEIAQDICEELYRQQRNIYDTDRRFYELLLLSAIFTAGRLQGIREERHRRRTGKRA